MRGIQWNLIALRLLGAVMMLFLWSTVGFKIPIAWKGGNRAPMSVRSKVVFACASTAWFLVVCGFNPTLGAGLFDVCILYGFILCDQDRASYAIQQGLPERPRPTAQQTWLGLCIFDALILFPSFFAFFRDFFLRPATEE